MGKAIYLNLICFSDMDAMDLFVSVLVDCFAHGLLLQRPMVLITGRSVLFLSNVKVTCPEFLKIFVSHESTL